MKCVHWVRAHTYKALKEGFFPIVVGGDSSLMLGTIQAMRRHQDNTKLLLLDHSQRKAARTAKARNENIDQLGLSYLAGEAPLYRHLKCVDIEQDVCILGGSPLKNPHNAKCVKP